MQIVRSVSKFVFLIYYLVYYFHATYSLLKGVDKQPILNNVKTEWNLYYFVSRFEQKTTKMR